MSEFLRRIRLPLLFAALVIGTLALMLGDRRPAPGDRHWLAHALLEVAAPLPKVITGPVNGIPDAWHRFAALVEVEAGNRSLRERISQLEPGKPQLRAAHVSR